jgi:hypothetical protein
MEKRLIESRFTYTKKEKINEIDNEKIDKIQEEVNALPKETFFENINNQIEKTKELKTNVDSKVEKETESIVIKNIKEFFSTNLLAKIGAILVFI